MKKGLIYVYLFCSCSVFSQHSQFSQFYAAQIYLNPAFTGASSCTRFSMNYRNQWNLTPGGFNTYQVSFDKPIRKYNSGVGITLFSDRAGPNSLKSNQVSGLYAYELKINKKLVARAGLSAGFTQRSLDYSGLLFSDQIANGGGPSSSAAGNGTKILYFDVNAGYLMYSENIWGGVALSHLTRPNQSLTGDDSRLPIEVKFHGGYKYLINDQADKSKDQHFVTAAFNYKRSLRFNQIDIGAYYARGYLVFGMWYRGIPIVHKPYGWYKNNDALVFVAGISGDKIQIGYSFDYTISKLTLSSSGGSHELSMMYLLCSKKKKKKKLIMVSCPKF